MNPSHPPSPSLAAMRPTPGARLRRAALLGFYLGAIPVAAQTPPATPAPATAPNPTSTSVTTPPTPPPGPSAEDLQISFQGANIDMVVQWLAKVTGKSVVKHPQVQCQLTIVGSKGLSLREAINLVYRSLSLEGFSAVESSQSIFIVPEGKEPRMSPELLPGSRSDIPEGRQRLIRMFPVKHIQLSELKDRLRSVVSDKGTLEIDDRANQLIVTDYNDNIRLIADLIRELDVSATGDSGVELYPIRFAEVDELANLLGLILNAQSAAGGASRSSSGPGSGPSPGAPMPGPMPSPSGSGSPSSTAAPQVRIWTDKATSRLIVAAPKSRRTEVESLIQLLDKPKPQDFTIRVLPLRNVSAEDLVREIAPLYQKMTGKSSKDSIEVSFNDKSNSLIVLSSEANFSALKSLVDSLDTEEAQEKVMQAFPLKNADAEDVAKQIQDLGRDSDSQSRYPFYFFSYSSEGRRGSKKPSIVADRRRNTVIVQAPPAAIEAIARVIRELDSPVTDNSLTPRLYRLKYVSAVDIEDVLNELFLKKQNIQRPYWYYEDYPDQTPTDRNAGRLYGKVRITSEPYQNAIIVTANSPEHLAAVEELIKQLDSPSQSGDSTLRFSLRFAKASTVANSINILFAKSGSPPVRPVLQPGPQGQPQGQQGQQTTTSQSGFGLEQEQREEGYFPWLNGQPENTRSTDGRTIRPTSDLVGRVRVVPDQRANAIIISANVHFMTQVIKLVQDMDVPTPQVLLEAKIVEVSTTALDKLGIRWSPDGDRTFTADDLDGSILARTSGSHKKGFGGKTSVPPTANLAAIASSIRSGVLDSSISLDFLIQFLRKNTDATILAEPQINIADNELGKLFVGSQVPFIDKSQTTDVGALNQSFQYKDVGVILEVTPHINNSGDVALKIRAESSSIDQGQTLFGGAILDTRNFKTDLTARSGETLILGGIIKKQVSDTVRKVPVLGSIPGLGWAFRKKDKVANEVQLMVFLKPKVTRTPEQARDLLEEIEKKVPKVKQSADTDTQPPPKKK